ncbi:hypothetical protein Scep_012537 [Stephania cephalantha]|uniref:C2 domain-containing protein n=1 Tax=Stephania cephalantha TaxID=152367 RepID=A0AAP0JFH8_9MAGN
MDAHQSVVPTSKPSIVVLDPEHTVKPSIVSENFELQRSSSDFIGVLEVFIHQARDIHNICIYHKQDVYAKVSLTSDPEQTVSTKIINGGGKNPVFNESLRLGVRTFESSLKCEVWMLSRVRNYLEDQLLGFALVPLLDVVTGKGKQSQEFSLSSTDLYHSPAGFVQLSLSYDGPVPEVMEISHPIREQTSLGEWQGSEPTDSVPQYDKIEFPDPKIVNENEKMVSEYFGIPCTPLDSESSECLNTPEDEKHPNSDLGVKVVECLSGASSFNSVGAQISESTHTSSALTNGSPTVSSQSYCNTPGTPNPSSSMDLVSPRKEKGGADITEAENETSSGETKKKLGQSALMVNVEPEQAMLQQDIVDMYMKSMQQFTESLAKMKLPMDIEHMTGDPANKNSSSDQKSNTSKANGSRVFYGSRAFF